MKLDDLLATIIGAACFGSFARQAKYGFAAAARLFRDRARLKQSRPNRNIGGRSDNTSGE
jgi:hypothetical protein